MGEAAAEEEQQAGALLVRRLHGGVTVQIEGGIPLHGIEHRALADFGARYGPMRLGAERRRERFFSSSNFIYIISS